MDAKRTGAYLAALRKARGMTQQETAEKLGVSNKTVSKWESGGGFPDITVLPALAALYGVTADELLAGESREEAAAQSRASEVEAYLARREEFRFRVGAAVAGLCLGVGWVYRDWTLLTILPAAALLALWAGWGSCRREALGTRLRVLLPLAAAGLYLALWRFAPWGWVVDRWLLGDAAKRIMAYHDLRERMLVSVILLLLPVLYGIFRAALRQREPGGRLLSRGSFWIAAAGWGASVCLDVVCWTGEWPLIQRFAFVNSVYENEVWREWRLLEQAVLPVRRAVLFLAAVVMAGWWLYRRKKGAGPLAEQEKK